LPKPSDGEEIDGDKETEEASGGGRQRDAATTEAEEKDVPREVTVQRFHTLGC
jgi:hypothetical protein